MKNTNTNTTIKTLALCEARHQMPSVVEGAVYPSTVNPLDLAEMQNQAETALNGVTALNLYVTGLTVALVEVIKVCHKNNIALTLYHYDRETGEYYPQKVF